MSRAYLITRAVVRTVFWGAVLALGVLAIQLFILAVWSLQF